MMLCDVTRCSTTQYDTTLYYTMWCLTPCLELWRLMCSEPHMHGKVHGISHDTLYDTIIVRDGSLERWGDFFFMGGTTVLPGRHYCPSCWPL